MDELIPIVLNGETADIKCWCYAHKEYCSRGRESVGKDDTELNLGLLGSPCVVSWLNCFVVLESDFMNPRLIQKWNKKISCMIQGLFTMGPASWWRGKKCSSLFGDASQTEYI